MIKRLSSSEYNELVTNAVLAGDVVLQFDNSRSNEYRTGVLQTLRGVAAEVFVTVEAIEAIHTGDNKVEFAHMGDINARFIEYTDGERTAFIIEKGRTEIVVGDLKENNDNWDKFAGLSFSEKIAAAESMGAIYVTKSPRGARGFDDAKVIIAKWKGVTPE